MPGRKDYYAILGLPRDATQEQIKAAFRKLAFKYHPDHNSDEDAEEKFKELNEAYVILGNPQKKAGYDRYGQTSEETEFPSGFSDFDFSGFGDIFDTFFGGFAQEQGRHAPRRGADIDMLMKITFEEAVFGATRDIEVNRTEYCDVCHGNGCEPGTSPVTCPDCGGHGQVRRSMKNMFGKFTQVVVCPTCEGTGKKVASPCTSCGGIGRKRMTRKLNVAIPAGIDSDHPIRLESAGQAGLYGGESGDINIAIDVKPHKFFERRDDNILYNLHINVAQAALGEMIQVPTVHGPADLKIPAGTQSGDTFELKGKGVPHLNHRGNGNQTVKISVDIPRNLTKKQRELIEELAKSMGGNGAHAE
jgi:molecular chaperone DnaJ